MFSVVVDVSLVVGRVVNGCGDEIRPVENVGKLNGGLLVVVYVGRCVVVGVDIGITFGVVSG